MRNVELGMRNENEEVRNVENGKSGIILGRSKCAVEKPEDLEN